jgi:hypothetical protein
MLETPTIGQNHLLQRQHLVNRHAKMFDKIQKQNSDKEKYWVLGWVESKRRSGKTKIMPKMQAFYEMPEVSKESYLYEIDNIAGTKELVWVMHPNQKLSLPSIGKSLHAADVTGV